MSFSVGLYRDFARKGEMAFSTLRATQSSDYVSKPQGEISMVDQVHGIIQAAKTLLSTVGTPHERLAKGSKAFRQATIFSSHWSRALWDKYNGICDTFLAGGTWQKTIGGMD
jgi:hypothetical protein